MLPFLNIFGAAIAFPPLIILAGLWIGATLADKHAPKDRFAPEAIFNLIFVAFAAYIIGGRLGYAAQNPSAFSQDPISLVSRNFGLFDPLSGAALALIAALIFGQRKQFTLLPTLDALTPAFAVFMLALPLANFASGNAFGAPSQLPWAVELWGMARHPVQLYEAIGAGLIVWLVWPGKRETAMDGIGFFQFLAYSALARLIFEAFRGSSPILFFDLRAAQIVAWIILAGSLWGIYKLKQSSPSG